jgi:hypothetical protein
VAEHPHRRAILAGVVALIAGLAVALIVAGGEDDQPPGTTPTAGRTTAPEPTTETAPAPRRTETTERARSRRDVAAIQRAVVSLVESAELGDAAGVCRALGQPPVGRGPMGAQQCADRANVDLFALPSSDELSFERVQASGDEGRAVLSTGATIELRRENGRWIVSRVSG